jgi:glycosyltransferase involved in cell wall biosynthesis
VKIEDWDNIDSIRAWDAWEPALLAAGYQFAWYDGLSRYYVRNEDVDLKGRLRLPPCVHDEFEFAELSELKHRYQDLISDRNNVVAASQRLDTELHAVESDRQAKSEVIDRLVIEVEELKRERDSLLKKVGQIGPDLERLAAIELIQRQKLAAKDQVIEALALRDLERKALLQGTADIAYQWRRRHVPPGYGEHIPPEFPANGLHVAIDTLEIVFGVSGGVETYMKMLASALIDSGRQVTLVCLPDQLNALRGQFNGRVGYFVVRKSKAVDLAIKLSNRLFGKSMRLSAATSMATFSRLGEDIGADILHSPVQIFSTLDFHVPSVLNLHDLQHLHFPENFTASDIAARNRLYGQSAALADAIVVSSEYVRNDLVSQMNVPAEKVFTVPVTWDPKVIDGLRKFSVQDAVARYQLPSAYAIYPAQFWPHKNHVRLVQALRIVRDKRPGNDLKLVFTGYRGHSGWPSVQAAIQEEGLEADVICLDHVPVEHLAALYMGSVFCVMPSTFEASSYPVIEAQVLGVPAMCSNVTSLPELMCDGAGLLFDPFDSADIAAKMLRWIDDPEDRKAHVERAQKKACRDHSLANYISGLERAYAYACKKTPIGLGRQ